MYSLVSGDGSRLLAEAESLDAILLAVATIRAEGEDLDDAVILHGGSYDPSATLLAQDGLAV